CMWPDPSVTRLKLFSVEIDRFSADRLPLEFEFQRGFIRSGKIILAEVADRNDYLFVLVNVKRAERALAKSRLHGANEFNQIRMSVGRHMPAHIIVRTVRQAHTRTFAATAAPDAIFRILGDIPGTVSWEQNEFGHCSLLLKPKVSSNRTDINGLL